MKTFIIKVMEKMKCEIDGKDSVHPIERKWKMTIHKGHVHYVAQGAVGAELGKASESLLKAMK